MDPERWQKIEGLYHCALKEERSRRAAFLEQACGGDEALRRAVESLLAQHEKDDEFLEAPAMEVAAKGLAKEQARLADAALPNPLSPATLDTSGLASPSPSAGFAAGLTPVEPRFMGPYRLLQKLGAGGMGQVWLAEQTTPVRRQVALKLIKVGMYDEGVLKRFHSERQSLAIMDHPSIAKVFDAGSTPDGQPYFVMEYVLGVPITEYCDGKRLSIRERLELFIKVCEGVQHAHLKAIIHRDLKPANILVVDVDGKPVPRIIDFGLAKATTPPIDGETVLTRVGLFVGTPGYMSPEQLDSSVQDVDTRADVYSLGAVLYVLLTGSLAFEPKKWQDKPLHEVPRLLREDEPPRPSAKIGMEKESSTVSAERRGVEPRQLVRLLHGDLDWITMKALEKDRNRRYGTPSALAADITRHLNHEPVVARPASAGYRLQKYVRRHRIGVAVATGLVMLLAAFVTMQGIQLRRTRVERDRANRERDRATRITDFMTGMFKVSDPSEARGNSITAREILDRASKDIDTGLAEDPELQAQLTQVMGDVYGSLALYSRAQPLVERAVDIRRRVLGPRDPDTLESMARLVGILQGEGHLTEAEKLDRDILDIRRHVLGPEHPDTLKTMGSLAVDLTAERRLAEAEKLDREVVDIRRRVLGPEHPDTLKSMNRLAVDLTAERRLAEAEKLLWETLGISRRVFGPGHPQTLDSMNLLAIALFNAGDFGGAEKVWREALDIQRRVLGADHPRTVMLMGNLAEDLVDEGRYAEGEKVQREMLDIRLRVFGPDAWGTAGTMYETGSYAARAGNSTEALSFLRQALDHGLSPDVALGIEEDPDLKSLHGDPRFVALVAYAKKHAAAGPKPD
jgi:non-specific serine/threonine protein kinase/serine/threonine-protein kinase